MTNFQQVTPFLQVKDLEGTLDFFTVTLGFEVLFRMSDYAYLEREGVGFRILGPPGATPAEPHGGFAYYIDVRDVDGLYAELKPKLAGLPVRDVHGPVDQEYGQRELMIRAPDGNLIVFGQAIVTG